MRLALLQGYGISQLMQPILVLAGFSVVLILSGIACFNGAVWLVKERGSLTQF
jgi:hypothetical protein